MSVNLRIAKRAMLRKEFLIFSFDNILIGKLAWFVGLQGEEGSSFGSPRILVF